MNKKTKKIKTDPRWPLICEEEWCFYTRECANHRTAGDFRTEDGIKPRLLYKSGELHCETFHLPFDENITWGGFPIEPHGQGFCDAPPEVIDAYEI